MDKVRYDRDGYFLCRTNCKNLIQIGTSSRIRKILKVALKINKKIDSIVVSSVVTPEEVQTDEYNYQ